jgi:hypothetical protein
MATKVFQVRDNVTGQIHQITGDEDSSPEDIEGAAQAIFGGQQRTYRPGDPLPGTYAPPKRGGTGGGLSTRIPTTLPNLADPTAGMSNADLAAAGLGESAYSFARGVWGAIPGVDNSADVAEARQRDAALNATTAGAIGNTAGTVALMLTPGAALKAGSIVADTAGAARAAGALDAYGTELMAPRSIPSALGVGGTTGYVQPAASPGERLTNTLEGAGATSAIPLVSRTVKAGMSAVEPFYDAGRDKIISRTLNAAAGEDAPAVVQRLEAGTQPAVGPFKPGQERQTVGELVPGSVPTTAQLAQTPSISKLESAAVATDPNSANRVAKQVAAQQSARRGVIDDIAGTQADRNAALKFRNDASDQTYDHAFTAPLDQQRVAQLQPQFDALSANPWIQKAVPLARDLAAGAQVPLDTGTVQGMHFLKLSLDDAIQKASNAASSSAAGRAQLAQMVQAQRDLVTAMGQLSPEYDSARAWHQTLSQPINEMETAAEIGKKSFDPITGNVRPGNFARALDDSTAQRATGWSGATLDNTLGNANNNRLQAVLADIQRADGANRAAVGRGSNTVQNLAYSNMIAQSGLPSWLTHWSPLQLLGNGVGQVGQLAYSRANNKLASILADAMTDPAEVARLMRLTGGPYADNGLAEILRLGAQSTANVLPSALHANQ